MSMVSIGLPVYNGQNYLAEAIDSVLAQTCTDWELVISDNASTDTTGDICRAYAAADPRIRYHRNETNVGAAPNYNRVWQLADGRYFKWLAHDDRLKPRYLEVTTAALEARPEAVLCNTVVDYIGARGEHLGYYRSVIEKTDVPRPAERFAVMILESHTNVDFFGLIRRSAMVGSLLHQPFSGADKAFLAQMALRGHLLQLEEPLVEMREHPARYTRATASARTKRAWHDAQAASHVDIPVLTLYRTCRNLVENEALSEQDRRECRRVLRRFWVGSWNGPRLVADLVSVPFPGAVSMAWKIKYKLFGAPGNFI
jgi:glycosyltransferase involved in cell wall biosynthesis